MGGGALGRELHGAAIFGQRTDKLAAVESHMSQIVVGLRKSWIAFERQSVLGDGRLPVLPRGQGVGQVVVQYR